MYALPYILVYRLHRAALNLFSILENVAHAARGVLQVRLSPHRVLGIGVGAGADGTAVRQKQNVRGARCAVVSADDRATALDGLSPRAAELMDQLRLSRCTEGHKRKPTHTRDQPENGDNDYHLNQGKSKRRQPRTAHGLIMAGSSTRLGAAPPPRTRPTLRTQ